MFEWERRAAAGDLGCRRVLNDIGLLEIVVVRLFYELILASRFDPRRAQDAAYLAHALANCFYDGKGPEDLHGHGRDLARLGRTSRAELRSLLASCIQSGVLEAREDKTISVDEGQVATMA